MFARRVIFVIALLPVVLPRAAWADDSRPVAPTLPEEAEPDDAHDLLFLAAERPVSIRLRIRVDGRSFRAPWQEFAGRLFRELDDNADGLLAGTELLKIPTSDLLIEGTTRGGGPGSDPAYVPLVPPDAAPADGLVTPQEFADFLSVRGAPPLTLQAASSGAVSGRNGGGGWIAEQLFGRLDADRDGRLCSNELADGLRALARIDFNDDGAISVNELLPVGVIASQFGRPDESSRRVFRPAQFVDLSRVGRETEDSISRQLLDQYDRAPPQANSARTSISGDDRLDAVELSLPEGLFERLDKNADGALEFEELHAIARHMPPEFELTVRIGKRDEGSPALAVETNSARGPAAIRDSGAGHLSIFVGGDQLEFIVPGSQNGSQDRTPEGSPVRMQLQQYFKGGDRDNNNYLDRQEGRQTPFALVFDSMDADGDGKLFEREVLDFVVRREAAAESRCLMTVGGEGRNLFELLDVNRDGRLGPREFLAAAGRMGDWDIDKDGSLAEGEIPAHFRVRFGRALPNIPGIESLLAIRARPSSGSNAAERNGPTWFRRMDKNQDGDISRREFLGPRARFDQLDTNHDGLIDQAEASRLRNEAAPTGK